MTKQKTTKLWNNFDQLKELNSIGLNNLYSIVTSPSIIRYRGIHIQVKYIDRKGRIINTTKRNHNEKVSKNIFRPVETRQSDMPISVRFPFLNWRLALSRSSAFECQQLSIDFSILNLANSISQHYSSYPEISSPIYITRDCKIILAVKDFSLISRNLLDNHTSILYRNIILFM